MYYEVTARPEYKKELCEAVHRKLSQDGSVGKKYGSEVILEWRVYDWSF